MDTKQQLELVIETDDASLVSEIETALGSLEIVHGKRTRVIDPVTAIAIAAGTVTLVNELLALQERLSQRGKDNQVKILNLSGKTLVLSEVTAEKLEALLKEDQ